MKVTAKNEKGFSLLEVLIAIAIIGVVCAGFLAAMNNAHKGATIIDQIDTSRALAEGQMEYIKKQPFATSYSPDPTMVNNYPGYSATITTANTAQRDANIQKITVTIFYVRPNGVSGNTTLEDCKVK